MGGLVAKRVFLASVVAIATTAVPPAPRTLQPLNRWASETLSAGTAIVSSLNEWLGKTIPPARIATAFQSDALTDGPQPANGVRGAGEEEPAYAGLGTPATPAETSAAIIGTAIFSALGEWIDKIPSAVVTASFQSAALTDGPQATEWTGSADAESGKPAEKITYASLAPPAAPAAVPDAIIHPPVAELKSPSAEAPAERPVYASLGSPVAITDVPMAAAEPLPPEETKITRETKPEEAPPEEKLVYASLGLPAAATDAPTKSEPLPPEQTAVTSAPKPEEMQVQPKPVYASLGSSVSGAARRDGVDPLAAISSRSAVESAPAERYASLGPTNVRSDALNAYVPPEKLRVAYDAPPVTERPKSIGKRQYVDDANYSGLGSPQALLEALRYMGANAQALGLPATLWCADFLNMVLRRVGVEATGSRAARSYLKYGKKIDEPRVGAIAIFSRGPNGGHIGIVRGTDGAGNPIVVSGNYNNKVAEALYPKERILAYVVPPDLPETAAKSK